MNLPQMPHYCKTDVSGLWLFNDKLLGGVIKPKHKDYETRRNRIKQVQ